MGGKVSGDGFRLEEVSGLGSRQPGPRYGFFRYGYGCGRTLSLNDDLSGSGLRKFRVSGLGSQVPGTGSSGAGTGAGSYNLLGPNS